MSSSSPKSKKHHTAPHFIPYGPTVSPYFFNELPATFVGAVPLDEEEQATTTTSTHPTTTITPECYPTADADYYEQAAVPEQTLADAPTTKALAHGSIVTFNAMRRTRWSPYMDVYEDVHAIFIEVDIPGFERARIDLNIFGEEGRKCIVIMGEEEESKGINEPVHARGRFKRTVHLPVHAQVERMSATYENGTLCVTVPKTVPITRVKKIEIRDRAGTTQVNESFIE